MCRGLIAPLSPNEENALIRLARESNVDGVVDRDLRRLRALGLVEGDPGWELTPTGRERLAWLLPPERRPVDDYRFDRSMG
jgi:hypothetical protein